MVKVAVSRSLWIDGPVAEVYHQVRHFRTWPAWIPWLVAAPGFELEFAEGSISWSGRICGRGEMRILAEMEPEQIEYDFTTATPQRVGGTMAMCFLEEDEGTRITWSFEGKVPWLAFWRKGSRQALWGLEFQRGLVMLKEWVETGEVRSQVTCVGLGGCAPFVGVGIRRIASRENLEEQRAADLREVQKHYPEGEAMTVYDKEDLRKGRVSYVTGVKLERRPGVVADGMELFEFPGSEVFTVRHFGDLRHRSNGWAGARRHLEVKRLKADRKLAPFEVYEAGDGEEPVVRIVFPLR